MKYLPMIGLVVLIALMYLAITNESHFDRIHACSDLEKKHVLMTGLPNYRVDSFILDDECFIMVREHLSNTCDGGLITIKRTMVSPESIRAAWKARK